MNYSILLVICASIVTVSLVYILRKTQPTPDSIQPLYNNTIVLGRDVKSLEEAAILASAHPRDRIETENKTQPNPIYKNRSRFDIVECPSEYTPQQVKEFVYLLSPALKPNAFIKCTNIQLEELQKYKIVNNNYFNDWSKESSVPERIHQLLYDRTLYKDSDTIYYTTSLNRESEVLEAYEFVKEYMVDSIASGIHACVIHTMYPKIHITWEKSSTDKHDNPEIYQEVKNFYEDFSSNGDTNTTQYSR